MIRFAAPALALLLLADARADAEPGALAGFRVVDAKFEKGKLTWTENKLVPVVKEFAVEVVKNDGTKVTEKRTVTELVPVAYVVASDLKGVKVTDTTGKAIDADKLAELLKETTPVVFVTGEIPDKHRALFKDKTLFIELPPPPKLPVPVVPPKK